MNNAETVALRVARNCLQASLCPRPCWSIHRPWLLNLFPRDNTQPLRSATSILRSSQSYVQHRSFSQISQSSFRQSPIVHILKPYGSDKKPEQGLKFQDKDLGKKQIRSIFWRDAPPAEFANRLLRVLHGRRHDGTLDLPLPEHVESQLENYPNAVEDGLQYLRKAYPIDEDEAIEYRIAREEDRQIKEHPSVLMQRGQDLGLYTARSAPKEEQEDAAYYGPQSGHYQADLSEKEGDPYGKSELDRMRAENDARRAKEEEELQAQIDAEMDKAQQLHDDRSKALAERPEQGLEATQDKGLRPPNRFERWVLRARNRAQSKLTLESPEIANTSTFRRLFPSFLFTASLCIGCYFFAQNWTRPKQSDRLFPDFSLSSATLGALIAANAAVWCLWRVPSAWAQLNKYFLFTPAYPYVLSLVGKLFSHRRLGHLAINMTTLAMFGLPLHEEIGRGNFLALYFASGLIAGFTSFARFAVQRKFTVVVLGASGSVYGVVSAYLALHMK